MVIVPSKDVETSIKVIQFSGKSKDWPVWEEKFLARSKRKGFRDLLLGKVEIPKSTEALDASDKERSKIRELNDLAYSELILSFADSDAGNVAFQYVRNSKSKDYEDGNVQVAWAALRTKFAPQTAPTEIALYKKFYEGNLKKRDGSRCLDIPNGRNKNAFRRNEQYHDGKTFFNALD